MALDRVVYTGPGYPPFARPSNADVLDRALPVQPLADYLAIEGLKSFINSDLILAETRDFHIPGTQLRGRGILAEHFLEICNAYVAALQAGSLRTDRQRENAIN